MQLKPLNDPLEIKDYILRSTSGFCDFSLGFLLMWKKSYNFYYAIENDTLILGGGYDDEPFAYFYPIGKDVEGALKLIEEDSAARGGLRFACLDDKTASALCNRFSDVCVTSDRRWSDYIYDAEDLKYFKGKKFSGQRNHINKFLRLFGEYTYRDITPETVPAVLDFLREFGKTREFTGLAKAEYESCFTLISNMFDYNCAGGFIETDKRIVAIAVGERIGDVLIEHIEKGLPDYPGAYQVMVSEFAKRYATDGVKYINREDDSGDEGLRTSKMQYHPLLIKNKNFLTVNCLFKKIKPPVIMIDGEIVMSDITARDKEAFCELYLDDDNNLYWGYDYREDIGKNAPTPDYFFGFQQSLKDRCEEYSLAVRRRGELIGEAVFHNFDYHGGVEIGIRIKKSEQGRGYAKTALKLMISYARDVLRAQNIKAKCFKANAASKAALLSAGFAPAGEDEKYYYFNA